MCSMDGKMMDGITQVYADAWLLAVDKPAGLLVHGDGTGARTLTDLVREATGIACAQADLDPAECAFVGDTLSRDVVGPRRMGFGRVFKINSFLTPQKDLGRYDVAPDYQITDIYDVYTILKQERDNA